VLKRITTSQGRQLDVSSSHLLLADSHSYVMAKDVHAGTRLWIVDEHGGLTSDNVSSVIEIVREGYAAPLTSEGTLIVSGVAASCYATIKSHRLAHVAVSPLRWWYGMFGVSVESKTDVGVHWFAKALFEMTNAVMPSIFQH
jgi:hypothetical protein